MNRKLCLLAGLLATIVACDGDFAYDESWGEDDTLILDGKTDNVLDEAPVIKLGETGKGAIEGKQISVYALDLKKGDQVRMVETITSGSLQPAFTLYFGGSDKISSTTYTASSSKLTKNYAITASGRYYVVLKAYRGTGKGRYSFLPTCTGGTCNGEPLPDEPLDAFGQSACLIEATHCAMAKLPAFNGVVGLARARTIFQSCVADSTFDGGSCALACDPAEPKLVCEDVIKSLPFYADQSGACRTTLGDCLVSCYEGDPGWDSDDITTTAFGMCWSYGYNGTCDGFARETRECGGSLRPDTHERCMSECSSTTGVWNDDLDTMCDEACAEFEN
jgi:hypothetical protein